MAVPLTLSSVPAQTPYVQYVSGSGQTVFPYPFEITQDSDLVCLINGVAQPTDSGYTLSGQGATGGGNLTFTIGQTVGKIITLYRNITIARITQLAQNGTFFSSNFNNEFNRIYLIMQQLQQSLLPAGASAFALMIPNSNSPAPTTLLTPTNYANKYLAFDSNGNPTPAALTSSGSLTAAIVASLLNAGSPAIVNSTVIGTPQTPAEATNSVVPVNTGFAEGNLNRYGTNTTPGTTDMSAALTAALAVGKDVYVPAGTYYFASASSFTLQSNQAIYGDGNLSIMNFAYNLGSNIKGSNVTDSVVRNLTLKVATHATAVAYYGVVEFSGICTNCLVENCDISGYSMCGVLLQDAVSCTVRGNYFHGVTFDSGAGDGAAVYMRGTSTGGCLYNLVYGNQIFADSYHGIVILTGGAVTPGTGLNKYNLVSNNRIGQQEGYGILASYSGNGVYDLFNQIIGNYVENAQGNANVAGGSSGAGIYCVSAGGILIANNTIRNCCVITGNESLAPAGVGVAGTGATSAPVVVTGNVISGMTQYHGIDVTSCAGPVNVVGNTILFPSSNVTGAPIKVNGSSFTSVNSNTITNLAAVQSIWVHIVAATITQISIVGNNINSANAGVLFDVTSGSATQVIVSDNNISSSTASNGLVLAGIAQGVVKGNTINVGATAGIVISACTQMRLSGNSVVCSSTTFALSTAGVCTDSYVDETNYFSATGGPHKAHDAITNGATGLFVRQFYSAVPSGGAHVVGDSVKYSAPAHSGIAEYICTAAGTPGTWTFGVAIN